MKGHRGAGTVNPKMLILGQVAEDAKGVVWSQGHGLFKGLPRGLDPHVKGDRDSCIPGSQVGVGRACWVSRDQPRGGA